jgi:hypothetical protein
MVLRLLEGEERQLWESEITIDDYDRAHVQHVAVQRRGIILFSLLYMFVTLPDLVLLLVLPRMYPSLVTVRFGLN